MNVFQLLTSVPVPTIVAAHNLAYEQSPTSVEDYTTFLENIRKIIAERSSSIVEVSYLQVEHDDPVDDIARFDVSFIDAEGPKGFALIPWNLILGAEVKCEIPTQPSLAKQAAHIFYEMTFHGLDQEDAIGVSDSIKDEVEKIDKQGSASTRRRIAAADIIDVLFADASEEERNEIRRDAERLSVNGKTARFYKNGVLQPRKDQV